MQRVLITGAAGFIGSYVAEHCLSVSLGDGIQRMARWVKVREADDSC